MLNIVVPMAGLGSRFQTSGYKLPKPLIDVGGTPMIKLVIENLQPTAPHRFIFICQNKHINEFNLDEKLKAWAPHSEVIGIDGVTEGAACTVLLASKLIDNVDNLIIANCDQYIDVAFDDFAEKVGNFDGLIMTMKADDNKWSFVRMNSSKLVAEVREKEVISDEATVGIYAFKSGAAFCKSARTMIAANERVNNEFYVAPVYNYLIAAGAKVGIFNIGTLGNGMHGIGTPDDLNIFLKTGIV